MILNTTNKTFNSQWQLQNQTRENNESVGLFVHYSIKP